MIAHNAAFDRPFCERLLPEFAEKPWACSLTEIPWSEYGFESAKLKYLLMESGYFFEGHRALDDCAALQVLLNCQSRKGGSFFAELIENARQPSYKFRVQAPYELRNAVKETGYRWSPFKMKTGGEWLKVVREADFKLENTRLKNLESDGVRFDYIEQDAFTRYRLRS